jgi:hypothetical protein
MGIQQNLIVSIVNAKPSRISREVDPPEFNEVYWQSFAMQVKLPVIYNHRTPMHYVAYYAMIISRSANETQNDEKRQEQLGLFYSAEEPQLVTSIAHCIVNG